MNKTIYPLTIVLLMVFFFFGCSSNAVHRLGVSNTNPATGSARLVSTPPNWLKERIKAIYTEFPTTYNFSGPAELHGYLVIHKIDGEQGNASKWFDPKGTYNSFWGANFDISIQPGQHVFTVSPNGVKWSSSQIKDYTFHLGERKKYFLGQLMSSAEGYYAKNVMCWSPILVDLDSKEIVFPEGQPKWSIYSTSTSELIGEVSNPKSDTENSGSN